MVQLMLPPATPTVTPAVLQLTPAGSGVTRPTKVGAPAVDGRVSVRTTFSAVEAPLLVTVSV